MKRTRIRRIIVRETETTIVKSCDFNKKSEDTKPHTCPLCHSPIPVKQLITPNEQKLLDKPKS